MHRNHFAFAICLIACQPGEDPATWQLVPWTGAEGSESGDSTGPALAGSEAGTTAEPGTGSQTSGAATIGASTGEVADETEGGSTSGSTGDGGGDSTTGAVNSCGDGVLDDGEECDDPADPQCNNCYKDRLVFVTSQGLQGDWAKSGFDYWCNHLAALAGLLVDNQPRFKPWISTSQSGPGDRLFHSPGRYVLRNGLVFAESWDDIVAGNLVNPLEVDEWSQTQTVPVWTDTLPGGVPTVVEGGDHCSDWTDDSVGSWAYYGFSDEADGDWTFYTAEPEVNPQPCGGWGALYCFESP